jgi:hypothetical protein
MSKTLDDIEVEIFHNFPLINILKIKWLCQPMLGGYISKTLVCKFIMVLGIDEIDIPLL